MMHKYYQSRDDMVGSESDEESDSSIDLDNVENFSMANESAYATGVSLEDKLRLAASKGQVERIPELLSKGATYQPDREGRTAVHYAALSGYAEAVRMLIVNGCDVNTCDNLGYSALHRAAAQGHQEVVKVVCEEGCNLDVQDQVHGNSALHEAAWNGYSKTLDLLIKHKADVTLMNKAGFSALHLAAQNGHNQSGRSLLYAGASPDCKNNYGDTPLHTAARYGHAGVTRILISAKCRINEQNKNGDTALHIAAALKRKKIAKLLVESNVSIGVKNKQNETATDVSRRKDHPEIMLIITSQPKLQKQRKKEEKERRKLLEKACRSTAAATVGTGGGETDDQVTQPAKKEKKGFFFKKRSKSKDKESSSNKENRETSRERSRSREGRGGGLSGSQNDLLNGEMYATDSNLPMYSKKARGGRLGQSQGVSARVHGLLTNYESKSGVQYYRDLAGNIKQGPIGYAPTCHCDPAFDRGVGRRLDSDRSLMYDHVDATRALLQHRIDDVDHRCTHQIQRHEAACGQRLDSMDSRMCGDWLQARLLAERRDMEQAMLMQEHLMRSEYQDYVGRRGVGARGRPGMHAPVDCHGCEHCPPAQPRMALDDTDLHRSSVLTNGYHDNGYGGQGGIYRTRSDETLSVSSSHPSRRHWKMRSSKSKSIREFKERYGGGVGGRAEGRKEKREPPLGQGSERPMVIYEEKTPSGRSPEGQSSGGNDYTESSSFLDPVHYGAATRSQPQRPNSDLRKGYPNGYSQGHIKDIPGAENMGGNMPVSPVAGTAQATSTPIAPQAQPVRTAPQLPPKPNMQTFYSHVSQGAPQGRTHPVGQPQAPPNSTETTPKAEAPYNSPADTPNSPVTPNSSYNNTTNCSSSRLTTSGSSYVLSPDQIQVQHSKTDSGSNPDSGYSSKVYGVRPAVSGKSIGAGQGLSEGSSVPQRPSVPQYSQNQQPQQQGAAPRNPVVPAGLQRSQPVSQTSHTNPAPNTGFSRPTAAVPKQHPMPMVPPQQGSRYGNTAYSGNRSGPSHQYDNGTGQTKTVHKNRGYSSDGCPGMPRPKPDAYASDNCSGMRYPSSQRNSAGNLGHQYQRSVLTDWFSKHQASGNGPIREVPSQGQDLNRYGVAEGQSSQQGNTKQHDFWPGKATQV